MQKTERADVHPLLQLQAQADLDRWDPTALDEDDHGTWDGRWSFICERDWKTLKEMGKQLPCGSDPHDAFKVQAARKEYVWSQITPSQKKLWGDAAVDGWNAYIDNQAIQVLSMEESRKVWSELKRKNETDRVLVPRFVCTDKHDGLRTASHPLPVKASSRLVVPGFKDRANLEGTLRRDSPTGSRLAQHFLFAVAAFQTSWALISADVKSAFLKGDPFVDRELYITNTNPRVSPPLPLQTSQLCRVLKGIFGLADAPRQWWLRLSRSMQEHGWKVSLLDAAMWTFWKKIDGKDVLQGIVVGHVDDLLFCGSPLAEQSLIEIGRELGFGSLEREDFTWCGKRIRRASDGTIRLSMHEYHDNLSEIVLPRHRKSEMNSPLDKHEHRQLRAVLGSLQWLVAQLRFDMSFAVSTLQGEHPPNVETVLKANALVKEFQRTSTFELIFRAVDYRTSGICMVSDAALGNVKLNGATNGTPQEKVYPQACYFALLADEALLNGKEGVFNILDARSHRIPRVCRSTYSAETLAAEEAMDVGQLCRGCLALLNDPTISARDADVASNAIRMTTVVDAKDVHDKSNSDTSTYGTQKSLAFCIAWMRSVLRRPNTAPRWTSTENMWVDGGTKQMDLSHMRRIMQAGRWSISYSPEFVKQVVKARSAKPSTAASTCVDELLGVMVDGNDPLLPHLQGLCEKRGWHHINGVGVQVAHNAKSFRTPEPRFSVEEKPFRSTCGRFTLSDGSGSVASD